LRFLGRKKQFNTGIQALGFSSNGKVLFSSAGQKEVSTTSLRLGDEDILSVEFGGFSDNAKIFDGGIERDEDDGGDLRIMGLDVIDYSVGGEDGWLVALVFSDSTLKVKQIEDLLI
jgi:hypothetical protein